LASDHAAAADVTHALAAIGNALNTNAAADIAEATAISTGN